MEHFYGNRRSRNEERSLDRPRQDVTAVRGELLSTANARSDEPVSDLLQYWNAIRRHKKTIAFFTFAFAIAGFLIGLPQDPVYRARTSLEILSLNDDFMNMRQTSPTSSNDLSNDTSELQTEATLLESDSLQEAASAKLDDRPHSANKAFKSGGTNWKVLLHLEPDPRTPREKLIAKAAKSLRVRPIPRTRIIEITADSTDPQFASEYIATLADLFIQRNLETRWYSTEKTSAYLKRELSDTRNKLERSEEALQKYAGTSGLIFSDQQDDTTLSTEKLQQVQSQLAVATADRITKQSRYELAQHSPASSLADVLADSALREQSAKIIELRKQIANMSSMFTPEYFKLKQARAELTEAEAAFEADRVSIVQRIKNDFEEANRRERLLLSEYQTQSRQVTGQGEKAVQYHILKREVESNRELYDAMLHQLKQSSIASAIGASKIYVVDPAETGIKPIRPNYKINAAVGTFAGLFFGVLYVLMRDQNDRSLREPGDAQFWTNLPELGTIPSTSPSHNSPLFERTILSRAGGDGTKKLTGRESSKYPEEYLVESHSQPTFLRDSVRSVVTSILFSEEEKSYRPSVLVVTSPEPGDGKTTVVSHLGMALSEIQDNVLIIDADLRRPHIHEIFGLSNERGLTGIVENPNLRPEALDGLIQRTSIPGLHVLTSGPLVAGSTSLFYSSAFADLLRLARNEYNMVLIDTPPMLQMTEARVIGRLSDGVILVARAQQTTRDALIAANQRFSEDNIRVLGTIFNAWDPKKSSARLYSRKKNLYKAYLDAEIEGSRSRSAAGGES